MCQVNLWWGQILAKNKQTTSMDAYLLVSIGSGRWRWSDSRREEATMELFLLVACLCCCCVDESNFVWFVLFTAWESTTTRKPATNTALHQIKQRKIIQKCAKITTTHKQLRSRRIPVTELSRTEVSEKKERKFIDFGSQGWISSFVRFFEDSLKNPELGTKDLKAMTQKPTTSFALWLSATNAACTKTGHPDSSDMRHPLHTNIQNPCGTLVGFLPCWATTQKKRRAEQPSTLAAHVFVLVLQIAVIVVWDVRKTGRKGWRGWRGRRGGKGTVTASQSDPSES